MNRGIDGGGFGRPRTGDHLPGDHGRESDAIFEGAADFDLELIESRTFGGNIQELTRP